jgi:hypothetical protein
VKQKILDLLENYDEEILKADGFDDCIVGVVERCSLPSILCYDVELIIKKLMKRDGMSREDAEKFFDFNIVGAWMGLYTPCFLRRP